jgi:hypothetical protein
VITIDIYSHAMPNMQQDAVELVDDALQSARQRRAKKGNWIAIEYQIGVCEHAAKYINASRFNNLEGWPSGLRHRS